MNPIVTDFLRVGICRFLARLFMGVRGLFIVTTLTPHDLGQYAIWLLFVVYFSMLDFGVLNSLERDIPHYRGAGEDEDLKETLNTGWSTFFILTLAASLLLGVIAFLVFHRFYLALLLFLYLFADKLWRAHETNSRIHFQFRENGIALLLLASSSLMIIWILVPRIGASGIFVGFIIGSLSSAYYLFQKSPLTFRWEYHWRDSLRYIKSAIPLAIFIYAVELFHILAVTILAIHWDKATLGYFVFAFRIFQICLALFPYLIQQVMRTRMYFHIAAQKDKREDDLQHLLFPMGIYSIFSSIFWLFLYWWSDWLVGYLAPLYGKSVVTLQLLALALLPTGITQVCSDYLCSHVHKMTKAVIVAWIFAIIFQGSFLYFGAVPENAILHSIPKIYLASTLLIYCLIVPMAFRMRNNTIVATLRLIYLLLPVGIAYTVNIFLRDLFHFAPSRSLGDNLTPFFAANVLTYFGVAVVLYMTRNHKTFNVFLKHSNIGPLV